jgi:uncharacterized protein YndB with AHSA1/START domain
MRLGIAGQGEREIVMTRVFGAPRQLVFDAWTKPELFRRWFGPRGWTVTIHEMDVRPGGAYRYTMHREDGSQQIVMRGEYREIVPPERLVTTEGFEGFGEKGWRPEDATTSTALFHEHQGPGTTLWSATVRYPSKEVRDAALDMAPAWTGMNEGLDKLEEVLLGSGRTLEGG